MLQMIFVGDPCIWPKGATVLVAFIPNLSSLSWTPEEGESSPASRATMPLSNSGLGIFSKPWSVWWYLF